MGVDAAGWTATFTTLRHAVEQHAEHEETLEFPLLLNGCGPAERKAMGLRLNTVKSFAPTHPHPSTAGSPLANWLVGPYVSLMDRVRDVFSSTDK
ncbi:hemerythrin domain-containing protein [Cumulibacter manganitolerans]|uniref:hypothetical protein n=1 Tax=Cumulibacter manganitolerans TaxID=1884992 RepID=UPI001E3D0019|nr:hypothetical protein [Cumulibacter manganitolerans]